MASRTKKRDDLQRLRQKHDNLKMRNEQSFIHRSLIAKGFEAMSASQIYKALTGKR